MKKFLVLGALFIIPILAYVFFASGINNFARLPVLTEAVSETNRFSSFSGDDVLLTNKITILGFLGNSAELKKGNVFNLNQKIYKRYYEFHDFQMLMVLPESNREKVEMLLKELGRFTDTRNWKFIFGSKDQVKTLFNSLETELHLEEDLSTPYVFIIDKDRNLRGRNDDEDVGSLYGFDATSVAEINNKMLDDIKVILAEYRMALKKNNAYREK